MPEIHQFLDGFYLSTLHTSTPNKPTPPTPQARLTEIPEIHQFLDGFYLSRIGIRILIGQHIALHEPPRQDHIGLICTRCSPVQVAQVRACVTVLQKRVTL
jgi:hypothetical protein